MEMMRNPNAMREAMRSQDLAMSHIENLPGGFNALQRMYEDVQEPMMEAAAAASATTTNSTTNNNATANTTPTSTALPNPWSTNNNNNNNAFPNPFLNNNNAFGGGFGGLSSPLFGGNPNELAAMMNNPMVQQMMQNPAMQQRLQQMMSDPNALQQVFLLFLLYIDSFVF
jgi:ubiquilin